MHVDVGVMGWPEKSGYIVFREASVYQNWKIIYLFLYVYPYRGASLLYILQDFVPVTFRFSELGK